MLGLLAAGKSGQVKRLLVVTKGDKENGMGHVVRQCVLARELVRHGVEVWFKTSRKTPGWDWIKRAGFPLLEFGQVEPTVDAICIDLEHGPTRKQLDMERGQIDHQQLSKVDCRLL